MLGFETILATDNKLLSMSDFVSHSKLYVDYLCERKETCPKCLQCLQKRNRVTTSATPESVIASMVSFFSFTNFCIFAEKMNENV